MESISKSSIPVQNSKVQVENFCQYCKITQKQLLRCARCKKIYYCDAECQKKHWPTHKINCSRPKENTLTQNDKKPESFKTQKQTLQNEFQGLKEFGKLVHLGSGNFSEIFKAISKKDGKTYAIKQVQKSKVQRVRKQADLFMEKHCLSKLKDCDYVIKLHRTFQDEINLFIQMECPQNGQLWQRCKTFGFFSQPIFKFYAVHLVKAISILHNNYDIVHRDLKPENILLDENYRIKLIDFGTARDLSRPDIKGSGNGLKGKKVFEHYIGTPNYMAPECIHNKASEKKCDIYSLSGVFYFMKVGAPPFTGGSEFIIFKKSLQNEMELCSELFSSKLKDLILSMNKKKMEQRYDINEVMRHKYFQNVDWDNLPNYFDQISKCTEIQKLLEQTAKQIYTKYHKIASEGNLQARRQTYDKDITPILQSLKTNFPKKMQLSSEEAEWMKRRVEIMMIQLKVMLNYHDDYGTGFVEIYNNDFYSAEKIVNQVRNSKNYQKQRKENDSKKEVQNEDDEETEYGQIKIKKQNKAQNIVQSTQNE